MSGGLGPADWAVLGVYLGLVVVTGVVFSRRSSRSTEEYFLGGRRMPVWAVAVSLLATVQSAATFVAVPDASFSGDLTYLSTNIGGLLAAVVVGALFVPAFYRNGVATPYQLLEIRFGAAGKYAAGLMYLLGRVFSSGARVYIAAIPAAVLLLGDARPVDEMGGVIVWGIVGLMVIGVFYTLAGGIRSVIWTDVVQAVVYLGAIVVVIGILWWKIPAGIGEVVEALSTAGPGGGSKLRVLDVGVDVGAGGPGVDVSKPFTLLTAVTGFALLTIASHGTDQDNVQRLLTCRSAREGVRSLAVGVLIGIPAVALFLVVGLLLHVYYRMPELMGAGAPAQGVGAKNVLVGFVVHEVPTGIRGLVLAGLVAAGVSSINSTLNAMASTFVSDVYRPLVRGRGEGHYVAVGRLGVVGAGVALGAFACVCVWWHGQEMRRPGGMSLIDFALSVMGFAYAGLLGVFFTALLTRRGNAASVVAALAVGFAVVLLFEGWVWERVWSGWSWARATPGVEDGWRLGEVRVAYPWRLVAGTVAATVVCMIPRGRGTWAARSLVS